MPSDVRCAPLPTAELPTARRIAASAFAGEAFAYGMFGEDPIDRLVGMVHEYSEWPYSAAAAVTGAWVGDVLVAAAAVTPPELCMFCDSWSDDIDPTVSEAARLEREFRLACRTVHASADLPPHAHVKSVAADPFVAGHGVGAALVRAVLDDLWTSGCTTVVLECLEARQAFYGRLGFHTVSSFADPGGPDLVSVLMRADHGG